LQTPLLTDVSIDWGDVEPLDVTPSDIPDLYAGDSVRLQGRFALPGQYRITVRGRSGGVPMSLPLDVVLPAAGEGNGEAIALLWARSAIRYAMHQLSMPQELRIAKRPDADFRERVTQLGLQHSLLTRWTAFVAVSESIYNTTPEQAGETSIVDTKVAGVGNSAYPQSSSVAHGGYAAPEPGTWLGIALLLMFFTRLGWQVKTAQCAKPNRPQSPAS